METVFLFEDLLALLLAIILGSLLGLEREWAKKEAGLKTFTLICFGSALFLIIARQALNQYVGVSNLDPSRILGQIIIGIGFLGGGVIIFEPEKKRLEGLTTAADMWVTAAIGAAVGLELYRLAIMSTVLITSLLIVLKPFERKVESKIRSKIEEN